MGSGGEGERRSGHSLAFLALLSFLLAFFAARLFTTFWPDTVVVSGGIHFHHFWYGLGMIVAAGWLGIASNSPELDRVYALLFGLGSGLIADEIGLLLTLGDYGSELTYVFFIGALCFISLAMLTFRYREQLERDLVLGWGERTTHVGLYILGLSALGFAFGFTAFGVVVAGAGVAFVIGGYLLRRRAHTRAS